MPSVLLLGTTTTNLSRPQVLVAALWKSFGKWDLSRKRPAGRRYKGFGDSAAVPAVKANSLTMKRMARVSRCILFD
jgi:hypothetical protein